MRYQTMTGLDEEQLNELVARVKAILNNDFTSRGRPYVAGLFISVVMVLALLRQNLVQKVVAEIFGVSQSTVSRRWDLLREAIERALAELVPSPAAILGESTALVDGTLAPTWDWSSRTDLFSGKRHDTGFNLQIAATLAGNLVAVGTPVPGARHDAHAFTASGLAATLSDCGILADLGYVGCDVHTGTRKPPGGELSENRKATNTELSAVRASVERCIAHLKDWKMLGSRYRAPLAKIDSVVRTVTALQLFVEYGEAYE